MIFMKDIRITIYILLGGETSIEKEKKEHDTQNVYYFKYIVDNFLKSKSLDNIKKEEENDEQYRQGN